MSEIHFSGLSSGGSISNLHIQSSPVRTDRDIIFGEDIRQNSPPADTLYDPDTKLPTQITFRDARTGKRFGLPRELLAEHLLLLGGIGCGKTNTVNLMLDQMMRQLTMQDIIIIFDTKGDFYRQFYDPLNPNHILIANDPFFEDRTLSWNLFDDLRDDDGSFTSASELNAKEIARELFKGRESDSQPFFSNAAADLVGKTLIHLMRQAVQEGWASVLTTADFIDFFTRNDPNLPLREKIFNMVTKNNPDFASAQFYINAPGEKTSPQTLGVLGYIGAMLNDLFIGIFAKRTPSGSRSFSMRRLVREKGRKVVFFEYDMRTGEVLSPMYRLMFDLALKEALGNQAGIQQSRGNTYFVIDEFKLLPDLQHIDDALNFGRSLGVRIIAGLQSINQLFQNYGEDRGKVIASGFMNTFCFQTLDADSRKFISERFGETFEDLNIVSARHEQPLPTQRSGHVVEDWQIIGLDIGEAFIKLFRYPPYQFLFEKFNGD